MKNKFMIGFLTMCLTVSMCTVSAAKKQDPKKSVPSVSNTKANAGSVVKSVPKSPKYVFLFIGDGMSYPQFQAVSDYLSAIADNDYKKALPSTKYDTREGAVLDGPEKLSFMNLEVNGSAVTYDSCSFAPDSASTATSIATGNKTYSGMINVDESGSKSYETIAEKLHTQKGWKVGVISSVNLNHATPAAFYAHQASRNNYYEIGLELIDSGFEYFAGGGLTIGFAGTDYDTYLDILANQTISYAQFDEKYVKKYKENGTSFEDAMKDVERLFGLKMNGEKGERLALTEYEINRLHTAYDLCMSEYDVNNLTQEQYVLYGTYNPFSVTVTHILNNKAGVDFTSYSHTGLPVAVFAGGNGAEEFGGYYDNTDIYKKLAALLEVK